MCSCRFYKTKLTYFSLSLIGCAAVKELCHEALQCAQWRLLWCLADNKKVELKVKHKMHIYTSYGLLWRFHHNHLPITMMKSTLGKYLSICQIKLRSCSCRYSTAKLHEQENHPHSEENNALLFRFLLYTFKHSLCRVIFRSFVNNEHRHVCAVADWF